MLLKLIFILYKQGREVKMRAVQDISWKIREEFINLKTFYSDKNNEYYANYVLVNF